MTAPTELRLITEANGHDLKYVQTVIQAFEVFRPDVKVVLWCDGTIPSRRG
jgi:hypothetical protein